MMSEDCKALQTTLTDVLNDVTSMCAEVIKKSSRHLKDVESLDLLPVDTVAGNISTLFERITTNVGAFTTTLNEAVEKYKRDSVPVIPVKESPKPKLNLGLKKNGAAQETDVDLTNSDSEDDFRLRREKVRKRLHKDTKSEETKPEETVSDSDSEKTVMNFDVPMSNGATEDGGETDEFVKALDELDKITEEKDKTKELKNRTETMSFDFDDLDDNLSIEMAKLDNSQDKETKADSNLDARDRVQKENNELLDLLTKAIGDSEPVTEEDCYEALTILEYEDPLPSDEDSDESMRSLIRKSLESPSDNDSSNDWKPPDSTWSPGGDSESDGSLSDTESMSEETPNYELKPLEIDLKQRVDEMDDDEIDRLCNLENINKRKCVHDLGKLRRKKIRRRIKLLSSSSSSSLSSDLDSLGSVTPDLVIDTQRVPTPEDVEMRDIDALADELADKLDKEDDNVDDNIEISSESSEDEEKKQKKEEKEKEKSTPEEAIKNEDKEKENEDDSEEIVLGERKEKKRGTWRDEIVLWSDSDSDDDLKIVNADPLKEKEEEDTKDKVKILADETFVITDSADSNSDSDDVTFINETVSDDSSARGRRNIRAILGDDELNELTQKAKSEEDARILRLEEHAKTVESIQSQREEFVLDVDVASGAPLITVDYGLAKMLKPHQKNGVQFMWEACYESVEMLKTKPGTGCILAHCMGLGKTLQVITLIHTLFKHPITQTKHVLVICPLSTVNNWKNEFRKASEHVTDDTSVKRTVIVKGDVLEKTKKVWGWRCQGGVLIMGYETFQILTNEKISARVSAEDRKKTYEALISPGPDLIICDEGHQLKNDKTLRTQALMKVKTKRRIVLTGTPLQNNLKEYYYMVEFVKPHLLGTPSEYKNRFATPIKNGQFHDSRPEDIKLMKKRTHVLTKLLKKTIHRAEASILTQYLPEITDYSIFLKLTPVQMEIYTTYINMVAGEGKELGKSFLHDVMILNFNNLHPYTLQLHYNSHRLKKKSKKKKLDGMNEDEQEIPEETDHVERDWYKKLLPDDLSKNLEYSTKLKLIFEIIDETIRQGEKVLIFGQYLVELDTVEYFLKNCGTRSCRFWIQNVDYFRMDGSTPVDTRDQLCQSFNTNSQAKLFLLTHRVGGLGLNLTGANRVIMIGSNHNPSHDTQSMYRVYRFGQQKKCYVYRLLSLATMEEKIYHRCVVKLHLSGTVVDKLHFVRRYTANDLQEMYKIDFGEYCKDRPIPVVPTDKILATLLQGMIDIYRYHPHNSLLENRPEEELTDEDKRLAWDEFNSMEAAAKVVPVIPVINPVRLLYPTIPSNLQVYRPRAANLSTLVPNPMNHNTRGFVPRGLIPNGMRPIIPQSLTKPRQNPRPTFVTLFNESGSVGNTATAFDWQRLPNPAYASQRLQNIAQKSRDGDAAPSGEFNYALNKVV